MTIAQRLGQVSNDLASREAKGAFIKTMFLLLKHRTAQDAYAHVESERASPRVRDILKSAVSGATIGDWGANADYQNVQAAFQESLRDASVFDAVLANGMVRAPLRSRGFSITTGISGAVTSERSIKVISRLTLAQQLLELQKAAAIVVISKELGDYPGSQALFASELTKAVIAATDSNFLTALVAATTPTASAGNSLANITTDLGVLLSAVTTSATSRVFYVTSSANMKKLVLKSNSVGSPAFPGLTLSGGEVFGGVTAIASDSIPSGAALMFDATSIVGNADAILPGKSEQSTLQMEGTAPDSPPVAGTVLLSLWQNDLLALRMERFFGFTVMRSSGVASLSGVAY
jgi:hypothetical protein